jgi:hypothetical protein
MASTDARIVLQLALRQLAAEALTRARLTVDRSPDHDFYAGVARAADDCSSNIERRGEEAFIHESDTFREGYLKTAAMIAAVSTDPPVHLAMPSPDS